MTTTRVLAHLTTVDVITHCDERSIAVLPIGAMEQHGPHLPLATDMITADRLCDQIFADVGEELDLWRLPSLAYGKSNEHLAFAGTFSHQATTLLTMLDEIAASLCQTPIRILVILNGHGGNSSLLDVACRDIRVTHGLRTFLMHTSLPTDQGGPSHPSELGLGIHAGMDETSLMLHLAPDLVRPERFERAIPEWLCDYREVGLGLAVRLGWTIDDLSANGTLGDPTLASADLGADLFASMVAASKRQLADIRRFTQLPSGPR